MSLMIHTKQRQTAKAILCGSQPEDPQVGIEKMWIANVDGTVNFIDPSNDISTNITVTPGIIASGASSPGFIWFRGLTTVRQSGSKK
jgi:hypothetical protein